MVSKLHVSETTIDSLNQQLVELSRSESLTRAKEQHESVTNAMKKKHEEQTLTLKQKLDEAILSRDCKVKKDNNVLHFFVVYGVRQTFHLRHKLVEIMFSPVNIIICYVFSMKKLIS